MLLWLCALGGAGIVAWRLTAFSLAFGRGVRLLDALDVLLEGGRIAEALGAARESETAAGRVVAAGLARRADGPQRVARAMRAAQVVESATLARGLGTLAVVATLALLLGLLDSALALPDTTDVRAALRPTIVGAFVAIPALLVRQWLHARIRRLNARIDATGRLALDALARASAPPR